MTSQILAVTRCKTPSNETESVDLFLSNTYEVMLNFLSLQVQLKICGPNIFKINKQLYSAYCNEIQMP